MTSHLIAEIPVLDWRGPEFLAFYAAGLVMMSIWCAFRLQSALQPLDRPGADESELEPFQLAFLAAGAPRLAQLAIARLLHRGFMEWRAGSGLNSQPRLVANAAPNVLRNSELHPVERELLAKVTAAGLKGLPLREAGPAIAPAVRPIEVALASLGLRPTGEERRQAVTRSLTPLMVLLSVGILKTFIGVSRDKPIVLLILLLVATVIVLAVMASKAPRLTESGKKLLTALRAVEEMERDRQNQQAAEGDLPHLSYSLALLGAMALAPFPLYAGIHHELEKLHGGNAATSGGGCSSGCSSGCGGGGGDGGCGGGGCGGCGGGGD